MQVPIAESCFADTSADLLPAADQVSQRRGVWVDPQLDVAHKCSYDKKIYADGESWKPRDSNLACVTCSCKVRNRNGLSVFRSITDNNLELSVLLGQGHSSIYSGSLLRLTKFISGENHHRVETREHLN